MATDREIVARQIGREPRAFRRVVVRCPFGGPAITEQSPYDANGDPFPTTYYVTCRHLVQAISRLEAAGGVERWTNAADEDETLRESRARADDEQRRIRKELAGAETGSDGGASLELGIGGAAPGAGSLKCLHAHAAYALARPGTYELGERIVAELQPLWPARCCAEPGSGGGEAAVARREDRAACGGAGAGSGGGEAAVARPEDRAACGGAG